MAVSFACGQCCLVKLAGGRFLAAEGAEVVIFAVVVDLSLSPFSLGGNAIVAGHVWGFVLADDV